MAMNLGGGEKIDLGADSGQLMTQGILLGMQRTQDMRATAGLELKTMQEEANALGISMKRMAELQPTRFKSAMNVMMGGGRRGAEAAENNWHQVMAGPESVDQVSNFKEMQQFGELVKDLPFLDLKARQDAARQAPIKQEGTTGQQTSTTPEKVYVFDEAKLNALANSTNENDRVNAEKFRNNPEQTIMDLLNNEADPVGAKALAAHLTDNTYKTQLLDWFKTQGDPEANNLLKAYEAALKNSNGERTPAVNTIFGSMMKFAQEGKGTQIPPATGAELAKAESNWLEKADAETIAFSDSLVNNPKAVEEALRESKDSLVANMYKDIMETNIFTPEEKTAVTDYIRRASSPDPQVRTMAANMTVNGIPVKDLINNKGRTVPGLAKGGNAIVNELLFRVNYPQTSTTPSAPLHERTGAPQISFVNTAGTEKEVQPQQQEPTYAPRETMFNDVVSTRKLFENELDRTGTLTGRMTGEMRQARGENQDIAESVARENYLKQQRLSLAADTELSYAQYSDNLAALMAGGESSGYDKDTMEFARDAMKEADSIFREFGISGTTVQELSQKFGNLNQDQREKAATAMVPLINRYMSNAWMQDQFEVVTIGTNGRVQDRIDTGTLNNRDYNKTRTIHMLVPKGTFAKMASGGGSATTRADLESRLVTGRTNG